MSSGYSSFIRRTSETLTIAEGGSLAIEGAATVAAGGSLSIASGGSLNLAGPADLKVDGIPAAIEWTVGAEDNDEIEVTAQLVDHAGNPCAGIYLIPAYYADDAAGETPSGTVPDSAAATAGCVVAATEPHLLLFTDPTGKVVLTIGEDGADTWYLVAGIPGTGAVDISPAITFAGA